MRRTAVLLVLLLAPADVRANHVPAPPPDTIAVLTDATRPVLALDPSTGDQHVAYVSDGTLYHAWASSGGWLSEPIASSVILMQTTHQYGGFDLRVAPDGRIYALYRRSSDLEFSERVGGVWQPHVLDAVPAQVHHVSLAASPVTGEPVVAWTKAGAPGSPAEIKFARRSAGSWAVQVVDTVSLANSKRSLSLAVDYADRPRIAWARPRGDDDPRQVLTCAIASGPNGPFVATAVDSQLVDYVTLAVDPSDGEPRMVYEAVDASDLRVVRYIARDEGLAWQGTTVTEAIPNSPMPPALALDPSGNPFIAAMRQSNIEPAEVRVGDPPAATHCLLTKTTSIRLFHRAGGAGAGSFQWFDDLARPHQSSVVSGPRALASRQTGVVDVAWRHPDITCAPYEVSITRRTPLADVTPGPAAGVALAPIAPNPARLGGPLRVTFRLEWAAGVALELRDVAGRQVAESSLGEMGPGPHQLDWSPAAPRAGVYWLTVRANGARLGSRSAVLVR